MNSFPDIDLAKLPAPDIIEALDFETILKAWKADFKARYPKAADVLDLESEPVVKLMETGAYRELMLRQRINDAARAVMLAHAKGADLDQLAALTPVSRLKVSDGNPHAVPPVPPTLESDDAFRARIRMAPRGFSVAGPESAYKFHGMSVAGVQDISVTSDAPCEVVVTVLGPDGVPSAKLVEDVRKRLMDGNVRPLTDDVTVQAAIPVAYTISATLHFGPGPDHGVAVSAARTALDAYVESCRKLGVGVALSGIHAALHQPGVLRVELSAPTADITVAAHEFAAISAAATLEVA